MIVIDPKLGFSPADGEQICREFLQAETVFKIAIQHRNVYQGIDIDALLNKEGVVDAEQRKMMKALSYCIHLEILQIYENGQKPIKFENNAYDAPIAKLMEEKRGDGEKECGYCFVTCNDREVKAHFYRLKKVGLFAVTAIFVSIMVRLLIYSFVNVDNNADAYLWEF